ncbi:MAG: hypothetical protein ACHQ49_13300 [Elusimicrobiota bacterium]
MPGFYRKKRRKAGPNKNQEKVQRGREADAEAHAAGTLATRFPAARGVKVRITVTSPQNVVLDETDDLIGPNDPFQIGADCPGRCGSGSYDFSELVAASLTKLEEQGSAQLICAEPLYGGGPDSCGCVAKCDFEAEFAPS